MRLSFIPENSEFKIIFIKNLYHKFPHLSASSFGPIGVAQIQKLNEPTWTEVKDLS